MLLALLACSMGDRRLQIFVQSIVIGSILKKNVDELVSILLLLGVLVLRSSQASKVQSCVSIFAKAHIDLGTKVPDQLLSYLRLVCFNGDNQ